MDMEQVLRRVTARIRSGQLTDEAKVKKSAIEPILRGLEWDDEETAEVEPEFSIPGGRVDYALHGTGQKPFVFLEAKRLGLADESGIEQVFGYASNQGVPFLILTDGDVWDFYLSMADGTPAERRFYRIELQRDDSDDRIADHARFFEKYLHKNRVTLPDTRLDAEQLRTGDRQREEARKAIPGVWLTLLTTADESLCSLITDAVEGKCGTQPELDDVEAFLKKMSSDSPVPLPQEPLSPGAGAVNSVVSKPEPSSGGKIVGFVLNGERVETGIGNRTLAEVIKKFGHRDPTFMGRFAARTRGRTRRLVHQTREGLYDQIHLRDYAIDLGNGWWLGTNLGTAAIRKNIGIACSVASVQIGSQITLIER